MSSSIKVHFSTSTNAENPYIKQLVSALEKRDGINVVTGGQEELWERTGSADILHIQWPEYLTPYGKEVDREDLKRLCAALSVWSDHARIVVTVHNEYPHYQDTPGYRAVYRLVYAFADGIIHLGDASKKAVQSRYSVALRGSRSAVIPHGNYDYFRWQEIENQCQARKQLGLSEDAFVVLCFGTIRHPEELRLVVDGFSHCSVSDRRLVIAGRIQWPSRKWRPVEYAYLWGRTHLDPRVSIADEFVPDNMVATYLAAADAVIIPRTQTLNSGNVALGFTFGRVVAGPNEGVVGEVLRETGNPTFDANAPASVGSALDEARRRQELGKGVSNQDYAYSKMEWSSIAEQHEEVYRQLMQS
jgi:hypothetical protein